MTALSLFALAGCGSGIAVTPDSVAPLQISSSLPPAVSGMMYNSSLQATGGSANYTWSVVTGTMPAGLQLEKSSGAISGVPTDSGTSEFGVAVSDGQHAQALRTVPVTLTVVPQLAMVDATMPPSHVGGVFFCQLGVKGGQAPYSWSAPTGQLPPGVTTRDGLFLGIPTAPGSYTATFKISDSGSPKQVLTVPLTIQVDGPLSIAAVSQQKATVGAPFALNLSATGGTPTYTWVLTGGSLPSGLNLAPATGVVSGTPTATGTYNATIAVQDRNVPFPGAATANLNIAVTATPLVMTAPALPSVTINTAYKATFQATGGVPGYSWTTVGTLPPGLAMSASTGTLSGTPTTTGTYSFGVQVNDGDRPAQTKTTPASITVTSTPLAITSSALASATVNTSYQAALRANGGIPAYTWTALEALPSGLALNGTTGVVSGTPTSAGTYSFAVQVSDAGKPAQTKIATASINVAAAPLTIAAPALPSATVNSSYQAAFQANGGTPAYTWTALGTLPSGLSLNAATGALTGSPTKAGTYSFSVQVSDGGRPAQSSAATASITVAGAPATIAAAAGTTWYVRKDGGTRYGPNRTNGQCDGKGDGPYRGVGVNQHCAFNDVRYLWLDGNYDNGVNQGWVIAGGDTVILRGSISDDVTYRIGWNKDGNGYEQSTDTWWGKPGNPYASGMPVPPSGTASQHTRILGENYGSCHKQSDRTQLHGGYGVGEVIKLTGASYVDLQCLDITDFSSCGRSAQINGCNSNIGSLDDYAGVGVSQNNTTNHVTLTDMRLHGLAGAGLYGPNGDGNVYSYIDLIGNANSGWNADNGTVGIGSALMQNFSISWNGCSEEYPILHALPYTDCTDDNVGGYGDGFGTATINSTVPWNITFDNGTVSYNTQDGLDALHLTGSGSSMTITRVQAYGNMGQQIKIGGSGGSAMNNLIVTNCNAMRMPIPGTPVGYNLRLSDFCRAADTGIYMATQDGSTTRFDFNTVYSASATTVQIGCGGTCTAGTDLIDFRNNIILGFKNNALNGYLFGSTNDYANPIYVDGTRTFGNSGSVYDHNVTYHGKSTWACPSNPYLRETNAKCVDPGLVDETWHNYGIGTMSPVPGVSLVIGAGVVVPGVTTSMDGQTRATPPTIGAYEQ